MFKFITILTYSSRQTNPFSPDWQDPSPEAPTTKISKGGAIELKSAYGALYITDFSYLGYI